jgi:hypothetical protein
MLPGWLAGKHMGYFTGRRFQCDCTPTVVQWLCEHFGFTNTASSRSRKAALRVTAEKTQIGHAGKIVILAVAALLGSVDLAWSAEYGTVEDLLDHNEQYQAAYIAGVVNSMLTLVVRSPQGDPLEYALECNPKQRTNELERRFLAFIVKHHEEYRRTQVAKAVLDFMLSQCEK